MSCFENRGSDVGLNRDDLFRWFIKSPVTTNRKSQLVNLPKHSVDNLSNISSIHFERYVFIEIQRKHIYRQIKGQKNREETNTKKLSLSLWKKCMTLGSEIRCLLQCY